MADFAREGGNNDSKIKNAKGMDQTVPTDSYMKSPSAKNDFPPSAEYFKSAAHRACSMFGSGNMRASVFAHPHPHRLIFAYQILKSLRGPASVTTSYIFPPRECCLMGSLTI